MDIIRKPNGFKLTKIKKKTRSGRITQKTLKIPKFIYLNISFHFRLFENRIFHKKKYCGLSNLKLFYNN